MHSSFLVTVRLWSNFKLNSRNLFSWHIFATLLNFAFQSIFRDFSFFFQFPIFFGPLAGSTGSTIDVKPIGKPCTSFCKDQYLMTASVERLFYQL